MSAAGPKNIKSNGKSKNRDYNIYTEEYFGGSDVFIYINGRRHYHIAAIQFSVQEQHKPIYGYSSRTFDDVAIGNRIVVGAIKVPVKNEGDEDRLSGRTKGIVQQRAIPSEKLIGVPEWVYSYKPNPDDSKNNTAKFRQYNPINEVADVQEKIGGMHVTGVLDNNTKANITKYKKNNNLVVNSDIDVELKNHLGIKLKKYIICEDTTLHIGPSIEYPMIKSIPKDEVVNYENEFDNWVLIKLQSGEKGYIEKENLREVV